jgi:carbonyl reductase 1
MKKTALVTGGNRGIGEQVCRELARAGWDILLAARDPKKGEPVAAHLRKVTGGRVKFVSLDVTSPDSIAELTRRPQHDAIRLDALVNNAGVYGERRGPERTRRPVETNFFGPLPVTEVLLPLLNDDATITNVTSGLGALANLSDLRRRQLADPRLTRERLAPLMEECVTPRRQAGGPTPTASRRPR